MNKISSMLDAVADSLEARGLIKEAYELDKVADSLDRVAGLNWNNPPKPAQIYEEKDWKQYQHKGTGEPDPKDNCPVCDESYKDTVGGAIPGFQQVYHKLMPANAAMRTHFLNKGGIGS